MNSASQQLLTISQLAKYAGVTVRAVRHYHSLGLLPEPPRDRSGYRRYGADAVIKLTRIKILADAGVPLSQIETLTRLPPETFKTTINSIRSNLNKRMAELASAKKSLDSLQTGDRMFVSKAIAHYLSSLRRIGLSETIVSFERDTWILLSALHPSHADAWVTQKEKMVLQPDIASLYRRLDKARSWQPDDPRINRLARDVVRISSRRATPTLPGLNELAADRLSLSLISNYGVDTFASWKRLRDTLQELANS
jgi:DNA-binding transcriptional MerR regulator